MKKKLQAYVLCGTIFRQEARKILSLVWQLSVLDATKLFARTQLSILDATKLFAGMQLSVLDATKLFPSRTMIKINYVSLFLCVAINLSYSSFHQYLLLWKVFCSDFAIFSRRIALLSVIFSSYF